MAGIWISAIGAVVGSTVAVLVARASVGTCLGCLAGVFLVLVDDRSLFRSQAAVSLLFGALIAVGVAFSWHQGHASGAISPVAFLQRWCGLCGGVNPYARVAGEDGGASAAAAAPGGRGRVGAAARGKRTTWTYPDNHNSWNYFDTDALPHGLRINAESALSCADELANSFGFQDDNVRNQVEHLMTLLANHRRYATSMPTLTLRGALVPHKTAIHSLHAKLFRNYRDWCESMRIAPCFMPHPPPNDGYGGGHGDSGRDKLEEDALMMDLMLWLCMWGEAGNLRHMPECLCFLFHKMMQHNIAMKQGGGDTPNLYGGYFLDHVVTPIYEVITRKKKRDDRTDHQNKLNYDDLNEFFWTPTCLIFSYRSDDVAGAAAEAEEEGSAAGGGFRGAGGAGGSAVLPVAVGMEDAPKTFVEKRSMLSTVLCFHRVLEFHILTFQMCAVVAFANMMVWDKPYFLQMASSVFWSANFLGIVWTILEVWQAFPGIQMTGTAKGGLLVRLGLRFLVLVYQSLYFMWSTQRIPVERTGMQAQGGYVFWWWQYLWLSFLAMVPYALECFQQVFPPIATWLCNCDSDYLQALLNICYPLSRVYVGKRVDEPVGKAFKYIFFWGTLLAWKIYFSYKYEVLILVLPSVELYDDYVNYPETSYWGMFFLILLRWVPQMFIYLIDTSIWFACWTAMTGSIVGFQERIGEVRDFPSIRKMFMQIPAEFCSKVICAGVSSRDPSTLDFSLSSAGGGGMAGGDGAGMAEAGAAGRAGLTGEPLLTEASRLLAAGVAGAKPGATIDDSYEWDGGTSEFCRYRLTSRTVGVRTKFVWLCLWCTVSEGINGRESAGQLDEDNLPVDRRNVSASLLWTVTTVGGGSTAASVPNGRRQNNHPREFVREFLDLRTQKWATFAAVWNEVINNMRYSDVISNAEQGILKFHSFAGFAKPVYLPIFQTAGSVELALSMFDEHVALYESEEDLARRMQHESALRRAISTDVTVAEALSEVWELGIWLMRQLLGPQHGNDMARTVQVFNQFINGGKAMHHLKLRNLKSIVADTTAIVSSLHHALPKRKASPLPKDGGGNAGPGAGSGFGQGLGKKTRAGGMTKSVSTSGLSSLTSGGAGGGGGGGVSSGMATEGRRQGMVGAHSSSAFGTADKTRDAVRDKLRPLLNNVRNMLKGADERGTEISVKLSSMANQSTGFMWDDAYASQRLDRMAQDKTTLSILEKLHGLLGIDRNDAEPHSVEARRRLAFFTNSLFMDMPRAPPVQDMMSWSCMTPFYSEDVVYSRGDLDQKNEDGLTTLMYLQALYKHDWRNFMERRGITSEQQAMSKKHIEATRLWASFRAQTLARTVEGIMYYEAALRLLARLERVKEEQLEELVVQKFQYVVACQVYGRMKKNQDPKADDIEILLKRFPNLRVAYIDEVRVSRDSTSSAQEYFSVLIKAHDQRGQGDADGSKRGGGGAGGRDDGIQEVYRVKLPGNPVVGEGKPENQNHAMIFTRGEHLQAIDMNQEGYFEEALKMRCLLEEFRGGTARRPAVVVGFREHIFTGSVSSLANYMALQELSFVTLGQRVLNNPLRVRMHYGHPDLFDKVFFMTAGGVSKASRGINLSEDIFAGYNGTIRGGQIFFKEYVQVGKGRDVGMQQIYKFEAKLSQGAAEQTLSRDVNRLGDRLDFFRLLSFYFGGLGYYVGNFITVLTVTFVVYFVLALAVFDEESIGDRKLIPEGNLQVRRLSTSAAPGALSMKYMHQLALMMLAGMGLLNTMPMLATLTVEKGLLVALGEVLQVFLSGGPMYFMFHIQTRAHYFYQTLLAGGAQYRATGRGFVTHHSCFDDLYRFFANSHFYLGFELMVALIVTAAMTSSKQYLGMTWSLWLACLSFLFAPFWFNPLSFHWGKVVQDYKIWMRWMTGTGGNSSNSWEGLVRPLIYVVIGYGVGGPQLLGLDHKELKVVAKLAALALALMAASMLTQHYGNRLTPWIRRSSTILITTFAVVYGIYLLLAHTKYTKVAVGLYYVAAAGSTVGLLMGYKFARFTWHIHDFVIGHLLFIILFLLSALKFPSLVQTWLLFHNALSEGVVIDDILKYARMNKELAGVDEDSLESSSELKKIVEAQAAELELLKQRIMSGGGGAFIGINGSPHQQQQGGSGGGGVGAGNEECMAGSVYSTDSGGYSYMMQPLGGDGPDAVPNRAEMMHPSNSSLNLADMANARASTTEPPPSQAFQFSSPVSMPPR
ncbi:GT48 [Ectocarpus sp. CCAP 1310/34]|nr:GT48 [Ectocarpus sp. CCAP 1310/34]